MTRSAYLACQLSAAHAAAILKKYQLMNSLLRQPSPIQDAQWQGLTAKFPGALRELEMCSPETLQKRGAIALALQEDIGQPRAKLLESTDYPPIVLWHDAHAMLRDLQSWRSQAQATQRDLQAMHRFLHNPAITCDFEFWPNTAQPLIPNGRGRPDQHTVYQWLAELAGIPHAKLLRTLVDRTGARCSATSLLG